MQSTCKILSTFETTYVLTCGQALCLSKRKSAVRGEGKKGGGKKERLIYLFYDSTAMLSKNVANQI